MMNTNSHWDLYSPMNFAVKAEKIHKIKHRRSNSDSQKFKSTRSLQKDFIINLNSFNATKEIWNFKKGMNKFLFLILSLLIVLTCIFTISIFFITRDHTFQKSHVYKQAAVATDDIRCSKIGTDILLKGGNAVDAAIASLFCLGVVRPFASGIGGGGFMLIQLSNGTRDCINFRERAPKKASEKMFENGDINSSVHGAKAIAVPSELAGMYEAHKLYGNLKWKTLIKPSIQLARFFVVDELLEIRLKQQKRYILQNPYLRKIFAPNGRLLKKGDGCRRDQFAKTLKIIANEGPDAFYKGSIGKLLVEDVQNAGGILTEEDLQSIQISHHVPISTFYKNSEIISPLPPSSSILINFMMNIFDKLKVSDTTLFYHYVIEVLKHALAHQMLLGDPKFLNLEKVIKQLQDEKYSNFIRKYIVDEKTFEPEYYLKMYSHLNDYGTTHLSIIDKDDNIVSVTSSVNHSFGSKFVSKQTGIILNNHMNDFTISLNYTNEFGVLPSPSNLIAPHKIPMSSMSPIIVKNKHFTIAMGASGGPTIISAVLQVLLQLHDFGMSPQKAVTLPRIHVTLKDNIVTYEKGFPKEILRALRQKGHVLKETQLLADGHSIGNVQVVMKKNGKLYAASDYRKIGEPFGY